MRRVAFRWHSFAIDAGVDYSMEPTTLIVFELLPCKDGIELTICETRLDRIPHAARMPMLPATADGRIRRA